MFSILEDRFSVMKAGTLVSESSVQPGKMCLVASCLPVGFNNGFFQNSSKCYMVERPDSQLILQKRRLNQCDITQAASTEQEIDRSFLMLACT